MNGFQDEKTPAAILEILVPRSLSIVAPHSPIPTPAPLQKLSTGSERPSVFSYSLLATPYLWCINRLFPSKPARVIGDCLLRLA